jgi:hypothetical protein
MGQLNHFPEVVITLGIEGNDNISILLAPP